MNNKIKDFSIKSGLCYMGADSRIYYNNCSKGNPEPYLKDFAELIINECISCISIEIDRLTGYQNSLVESEYITRNDVDICIEKCYDNIEMLKNHFGIE